MAASQDTADLFAAVAAEDRAVLLRVAGEIAGYHQADDVVQQALLNAWSRHILPGKPFAGGAEQMRAWLCRVTHLAALDQRRADALRPWWRRTVDDAALHLGALPDPDATPEEVAEQRESSADAGAFLTPFLEQLSPVYRRVLWTTYARGLTQTEAAAELGRSWAAVKTIRERAKKRVLALAATASSA